MTSLPDDLDRALPPASPQESQARPHGAGSDELTAEAVYWTREDGSIVFVSRAACQLSQRTQGELMALRLFDLDTRMDADAWPLHWAELRKGGDMTTESFHRRADGETYPVEIRTRLVAVEGEEFCCAVVHETSERRRTDGYLRAALEVAREANTAKDAFLANLSREFRAPLTAMLGHMELIASHAQGDPRLTEWIGTVRSNGAYLDRVLGDLLALSRIDAGEVPVTPRRFRLDQLLALEEATFAPRAMRKDLAFKVIGDGKIPHVLVGNAARLRQVLNNLPSNAIKYTVSGSVHLRVAATPASQRRPAQLFFEVEDTGVGIESDHQRRVFDRFVRFVRFEGGPADESRGLGLGLAIVQQIVERMGGRVTLQSVAGVGTRVRVSIPIHESGEWMPLGPTVSPFSVAHRGKVSTSLHGRILLADDVAELASLFALWLRNQGLEVQVVHDGKSALELARAESFDALVLDWSMPGTDGLTVVRTLRAEGSKVPILALTAHASGSARETCFDAGCSAYLEKPATEPILVETVTSLLAGTKHRTSAPGAVSGSTVNQPIVDPFEELRGRYVDSLAAEMPCLQPALAALDWLGIAGRAHRIKGSSASFVMEDVSAAARQLEFACEEQSAELAQQAIDRLVATVEAVRS